jgi:hypothetical protein
MFTLPLLLQRSKLLHQNFLFTFDDSVSINIIFVLVRNCIRPKECD